MRPRFEVQASTRFLTVAAPYYGTAMRKHAGWEKN
jgi:hypothetical protein